MSEDDMLYMLLLVFLIKYRREITELIEGPPKFKPFDGIVIETKQKLRLVK